MEQPQQPLLLGGLMRTIQSTAEGAMKSHMRCLIASVGIGVGLLMPLNMAFADAPAFKQLSAEWWQWALSIPVSENPILDDTGAKCVVGQRGSVWFLAGNPGGGSTTRACTVPEDTVLFFPVINSVSIDTPTVCGQGPERIPVEDLRAMSAAFIDGTTNLLVEVDGQPMRNLPRVRSKIFAVALPEENLFDDPCASLGGVPAGIYSPAVDEGFYLRLRPLEVGRHTLRIHAENPSAGFTLDVTYDLTVVPVVQK
jgi:hypothetical protein